MQDKTKALLLQAQAYCDENDKSTEFMLEYMQDVANVDLDCVLKYLEDQSKAHELYLESQQTLEDDNKLNKY